jgi:acetyl esterase
MSGDSATRPSEQIAQRIRAQGAVLDLAATQAMYGDLLQAQRRDGVSVICDLEYGPHERQTLDVYRPATAPLRAVMVFFHGGGFVRGDKSQRANVGYYFARRGYAVVVPNYRLAPQHRWPAGAEDVVAVWRWLRRRGDELALAASPGTLFLAGESAGAAHVALAVLARRFQPEDFKVAGALLISGVYNAQLELLARREFRIDSPDPRNEAYFGTEFGRYPEMSTVELIDAAPFPLWLSYAELDLLQMQVQTGELFARLVCRHGFAPHLSVIPNHNHLSQVYAINTGDDSLGRPMCEFMERH